MTMSEEQQRALDTFMKLQADARQQLADMGDDVPTPKDATKDPKQLSLSNKEDLYLMKDIDEKFDEWWKSLEERNRCTFSEYRDKWTFLHCGFEHSGYTDKQEWQREFARVSEEYKNRFCLQMPIVIVDDFNPSLVKAVIPSLFMRSNLIQGYDGAVFDSYHQFVAVNPPHGRNDIQNNVKQDLFNTVSRAHKWDDKALAWAQHQTNEMSIKVLELFQPDHPYLAWVKKQKARIEQVQEPKQSSTPDQTKQPDGTQTQQTSQLKTEDFQDSDLF